jgi:hypothetical protein
MSVNLKAGIAFGFDISDIKPKEYPDLYYSDYCIHTNGYDTSDDKIIFGKILHCLCHSGITQLKTFSIPEDYITEITTEFNKIAPDIYKQLPIQTYLFFSIE